MLLLREPAGGLFTMKLKPKLVRLGDANDGILRENLLESTAVPEDIAKVAKKIKTLCKEYRGVGISANQLGIRQAFFFMAPEVFRPFRKVFVLNPVILEENPTKQVANEGCLSLPGRKFEVARPVSVEAEYTDEMGVAHRTLFEGYAARVFLHEYDHLRGLILEETGKEITDEQSTQQSPDGIPSGKGEPGDGDRQVRLRGSKVSGDGAQEGSGGSQRDARDSQQTGEASGDPELRK